MIKMKTKKRAWLARVTYVLMLALAVQIVSPLLASIPVEARIDGRSLGYTRIVTIPITPPIEVEITEGNPPDEITRMISVHQVTVEITTNLPASINTQFTNNAIYVRHIPSDLHQGPIVFNAEGIGTMNAAWQSDNSIRITAQDLTNEVWIRNHVTSSGQTPRIIASLAVAPREGNVLTMGVIGNGTTSPTGSHIFSNNEQVSISALPNAGAEFIAWRGPDSHLLDNATSAHTFFPSTVTTRNLSVQAEFRGGTSGGGTDPGGGSGQPQPTPQTITVPNIPTGWTVLVSNSTPNGTNQWTVNSGVTTTVQLIRSGQSTETFQSWSSDNISLGAQATNQVISFTMPSQNVTLIPTMRQQGGSGAGGGGNQPDIDTTRRVYLASISNPSGHIVVHSGSHHPGETASITVTPMTARIRDITFNFVGVQPTITNNTATFVVPNISTAERSTLHFQVNLYEPENQHDVNINQTQGGTVWSSHVGRVQQGTHINIDATPNRGYVFAGWRLTGATIPGSGQNQRRSETFVMPNNNVTISAIFERDPDWEDNQNNQQNQLGANRMLTIQAVTPANSGRAELPAPTANAGVQQQQGTQTRQIRANQDIVISAIPNNDFEFVRWVIVSPGTAQLAGFNTRYDLTQADLDFRMPDFNLTLRPEFRAIEPITTQPQQPQQPPTQPQSPTQPQPPTQPPTQPPPQPQQPQFNVMATTRGGVGGSVSGQGQRQAGTQVTLVATPPSGYRFVTWELVGGGTAINAPTNPSMTFTMPSQNVSFVAVFEPEGGGAGTDQPQQPGGNQSQVTMPSVQQQPLPPSQQTPTEIQNGLNLPDTSDPMTLTVGFSGLVLLSSFFLFKSKRGKETG